MLLRLVEFILVFYGPFVNSHEKDCDLNEQAKCRPGMRDFVHVYNLVVQPRNQNRADLQKDGHTG